MYFQDSDGKDLAKRALAVLHLHVKIDLDKMLENGAPFVDTQEFVRVSVRCMISKVEI